MTGHCKLVYSNFLPLTEELDDNSVFTFQALPDWFETWEFSRFKHHFLNLCGFVLYDLEPFKELRSATVFSIPVNGRTWCVHVLVCTVLVWLDGWIANALGCSRRVCYSKCICAKVLLGCISARLVKSGIVTYRRNVRLENESINDCSCCGRRCNCR